MLLLADAIAADAAATPLISMMPLMPPVAATFAAALPRCFFFAMLFSFADTLMLMLFADADFRRR